MERWKEKEGDGDLKDQRKARVKGFTRNVEGRQMLSGNEK